MRPIPTPPRLIPIPKHHRIPIPASRLNLNLIRQMALHPQRLRDRINSPALHRRKDLMQRIVNNDVERILRANAVLITLVLDDVHRAPTGCEARVCIDGAEDTQAVGGCAEFRDAAFVHDASAEIRFALLAEVAVGAGGVGDEGLHVERVPVVEVGEAEDGVVEAVFGVAVYAAGAGVLDGDWGVGLVNVDGRRGGGLGCTVSDVWVGEELTAVEIAYVPVSHACEVSVVGTCDCCYAITAISCFHVQCAFVFDVGVLWVEVSVNRSSSIKGRTYICVFVLKIIFHRLVKFGRTQPISPSDIDRTREV